MGSSNLSTPLPGNNVYPGVYGFSDIWQCWGQSSPRAITKSKCCDRKFSFVCVCVCPTRYILNCQDS